MNTLRTVLIVAAATFAAACSSTPSKPVAPAAPVAPTTANIAGNWLLSVDTPQGVVEAKMLVVQSGTDIKGTMDSAMGSVDYIGSVSGSDVTFSYGLEKFGAPAGMRFNYAGVVESGAMKGRAVFGGMGEGAWSAKRQ